MKRAVLMMEADAIAWGELQVSMPGGSAHQTGRLTVAGQTVCLLHLEWPAGVMPTLAMLLDDEPPERGELD